MQQSIFTQTLQGKTTSRPPVWFMRQAGRVLPSYMKLRETYNFQQLMSDPSLAAQVTLLPVHDLGVDAAILFSDILVVPQALGLQVDFPDRGPVFANPLCGQPSIPRLQFDPARLQYIYDAIDQVNRTKPQGFPLIGFCGGPLTTFLFMAQGTSANHQFSDAIRLYYNHRKTVLKLIEQIADASIEYAVNQARHGIAAFQVFETYAHLLPVDVYIHDILPQVKRLIAAVKEQGVPVIYFPKGLGTGLRYVNDCGADFVSIDWQVPLADARAMIAPSMGLQGNLDPRLLSVSDTSIIEQELQKYKAYWQSEKKFIFNLGHGITPDNTFANTKFVVDWVKGLSFS